jgi:hypothetical protein
LNRTRLIDEVKEVKVVAGRVAKEEANKVPLEETPVMTPPRS